MTDEDNQALAIASFMQDERNAIVIWLRSDDGPEPGYPMDLHDAGDIADAIERGDHRKG